MPIILLVLKMSVPNFFRCAKRTNFHYDIEFVKCIQVVFKMFCSIYLYYRLYKCNILYKFSNGCTPEVHSFGNRCMRSSTRFVGKPEGGGGSAVYFWLILTIFSGGQYKLGGSRGTRGGVNPPPPPPRQIEHWCEESLECGGQAGLETKTAGILGTHWARENRGPNCITLGD